MPRAHSAVLRPDAGSPRDRKGWTAGVILFTGPAGGDHGGSIGIMVHLRRDTMPRAGATDAPR